MRVDEIRRVMLKRLAAQVGDSEAKAMTGLILETCCSLTPVDAIIKGDRDLSNETVERLNSIIDRVVDGEPLQYVLGYAPFHGLSIAVGPGVLIPRPETSQLVDIVVDRADNRPDLSVIDVCCGSGCIAVALARSLKFACVTALDIDETAVEMTRLNADRLGVKIQTRLCDVLTQGIPGGCYDIIVSNPPYILESEKQDIDPRVLDHEPAKALFVPDDNPVVFYKAIAREAMTRLKDDGCLYFEINPRHVDELKHLLTSLGFTRVEAERDFNGQYRFIIAKK